MIDQAALLLLVHTCAASPQLIGSRGVIMLREGVEYRDPETVEASETVAHFAKEFQEVDDEIAESLSRTNSFRSRLNEVTPRFQTQVFENVKGRQLVENEIFDYLESRFIEPPQELQFNKFLDEVEIERATSPIRLLPGEGLPPTPRPPTRAPNRLVNLQRPSLGSQESVRSQNAQFGTVFGPPSSNSLIRPGVNFGQNTFLDSNTLVNSLPSAGFNAVPFPPNSLPAPLAQDASGPHVIRPFVNLNAGSRYLSQIKPLRQPIFDTPVDTVVGLQNSQIQQIYGQRSPPLIQDIGNTYLQDTDYSQGSFQDIGQLSQPPPSHQQTSSSDVLTSQYGPHTPYPSTQSGSGLTYTGDTAPQVYGATPQVYGASPAPQVYGASPQLYGAAPQVYGAGPEFNQPFVNSLAPGPGIPQGLGRLSHTFSEGPHHSLSIQHLH